MEVSILFDWANSIALFAWALMIFTPRWRYTRFLTNQMVIPLLLAVAYLVLIFSNFSMKSFDFSSLESVRSLFENDYLLLAGWIHYLAFDLMAGSWILIHALKQNIKHWWLILPLFFTFALGPIGLLCYYFISLSITKKWPFLYQIKES